MTAHTCTKHEPGARACYVAHGCRCRPCTDAATAWARRFRHLKLTGRSLTVDVAPVRTYLQQLGLSLTELEARSGVQRTTIAHIIHGRTKRTSPERARALMSIRKDGEVRHGWVDSTGTRRRLQALAAVGWSCVEIAQHLDVRPQRVRALRIQDGQVEADTANRIAAVYDRLWDKPPTGSAVTVLRATRQAQRNGWAPPLAWDDDSIDDPAAQPEGVRTVEITVTHRADVVEAAEMGASLASLCERFGLLEASVERALARAGRRDLWDRIAPRDYRQVYGNQHTGKRVA